MNELQQQMRNRWDEKGWEYDQAGAHGVHNHQAQTQWKLMFQEDSSKQLKLLDVGTGTGFVALLAAEFGHLVTAIDWSTTMLSQAQTKAEERGLDSNGP